MNWNEQDENLKSKNYLCKLFSKLIVYMTTNLVLKSQNSLSYASGVAKFKVFWNQFLEDPYAEYLVSFSFISAVDATLNEDDLYTLSLDNIGTTFKNIEGGDLNSGTSRDIGLIYSEEPHSSHARLRAEYSTNPPVNIVGRPNANILEVAFRDLDGVLSQKTPQFVLFLRFEKV